MLERYGHGGDLDTAAALYGRPAGSFLDFSSNMNPWGPPASAKAAMLRAWERVAAYPDPAARRLRQALAEKHGVPPDAIFVGNGAAEVIDLALRAIRPGVAALTAPGFAEYETAVVHAGGRARRIALREADGFRLRAADVEAAAAEADTIVLGHPNNPTGGLLGKDAIEAALSGYRNVLIDEAFLDFSADEERLTLACRAAARPGLFVTRSMTKFYAIPGLRLGYVIAHPDEIARIRALAVPWSVNGIALEAGEAVLRDAGYSERTLAWLPAERERLSAGLAALGLRPYPSAANFLLARLPSGVKAGAVQAALGRDGVLIRSAATFPGLGDDYVRAAVKRREDNERLLSALGKALGAESQSCDPADGWDPPPRDAAADDWGAPPRDEPAAGRESPPPLCPTIMVQGTASDVGKSWIVTALCRILTDEGYLVAPFKSQNMSLNSHVTPDGKEIGRAQAAQADACRIPATADMNPILLKPTGERSAQVVVHGKPLRDYDAVEYRERYLPTAERVVRESLARLRSAHDVVVLEGAGSPAEINLRDRDVVNMRAAAWADAPVFLVADIDRGGVFASLVGTIALLRPEERERVRGLIINKFRGDPALLQDGLDWLERETGKPVLGVVPYLPDAGLEDEDAFSLDNKLRGGAASTRPGAELDIAVLRLPNMSNFTDVDALAAEPDVGLRFVDRAERLGRPDAIVIPGTKNTPSDLRALRSRGIAEAVAGFAAEGGRVAGICGGYQMLGLSLSDPLGVEQQDAAGLRMDGLGLLAADTVYRADKRTERVIGTFAGWGAPGGGAGNAPIEGYEIHMGETTFRDPAPPLIRLADGGADGAMSADGRVWGTYVHGIFDNDLFRRTWLNMLRTDKGLVPLDVGYKHRDAREATFARLAAHVREFVDMDAIREIAGLRGVRGDKKEAKS